MMDEWTRKVTHKISPLSALLLYNCTLDKLNGEIVVPKFLILLMNFSTDKSNKTKDWALVHERKFLVFLIRSLYMV